MNQNSNTPTVTVIDNRSLSIRELHYHRHPDSLTQTDERITYHHFTLAGFPKQSLSPRQYDLQQTHDNIAPDRLALCSLNGKILHSNNSDDGTTVLIYDVENRPTLSIDAVNTARRYYYENNSLPKHLLTVTEQRSGETIKVTERFIWAENSPEKKSHNLAGTCIQYYDTAGLLENNSVSLVGSALNEIRQLLTEDTDADWQGEASTVWNNLLSDKRFATQYTVDATGAVLTQSDAQDNIQRQSYNIAGQLCARWLTVKGQAEQIILRSRTYNAVGQILQEEAGNGVMIDYTYEPETQRLIGIKTQRKAGHLNGAQILQDLRYSFDPVGNVISIRNDAEATRFWRNQKVVPENHYTYDSLYQLVSATGREMANASKQLNQLPNISLPDNSSYTNYTRNYHYDRNGNLFAIQHSAPASRNNYTTKITVSSRSNRAVLNTLTENPDDVEALFDSGGHQLQLMPGQNLNWNPRGELHSITPVVRDDKSDIEFYRYNGSGQRIHKHNQKATGNLIRTKHVTYLPGLELRESLSADTSEEAYCVINAENVQVLCWKTGKPSGISNNLFRYSHSDLTGNISLETDQDGLLISHEEYYPFGGTSIYAARNEIEASYKTVRYSGKEQDSSGMYYYGARYYKPWEGRWLSADPSGAADGLNLYKMVGNNPVNFTDEQGNAREYRGKGDLIERATPIYARGMKEIKKTQKDYKNLILARNIAEERISNSINRLEDRLQMNTNSGIESEQLLENLRTLHNAVHSYAPGQRNENQIVIADGSRIHSKGDGRFASAWAVKGDPQERVFIDPKTLSLDPNKLATIFIHELSHVHLHTEDFFYVNNYTQKHLDRDLKTGRVLADRILKEGNLERVNRYLSLRGNTVYEDNSAPIDDIDEFLTHLDSRENRIRLIVNNADTLAHWIADYSKQTETAAATNQISTIANRTSRFGTIRRFLSNLFRPRPRVQTS